MKNEQPISKADWTRPQILNVVSVFTTLQGEGPYSGYKAVFIRLAGCNLQCPACDTDYTTNAEWTDTETLASQIPKGSLVVLTGGEPLRQNLTTLFDLLFEKSCIIQIETNGILCPDWLLDYPTPPDVVLSPKGQQVHPGWTAYHGTIDFKYVVHADHIDSEGFPTRALGRDYPVARPVRKGCRVYIQPEDDKDPIQNRSNLNAAVAVCMEHNFILCLQVQKIVDLP